MEQIEMPSFGEIVADLDGQRERQQDALIQHHKDHKAIGDGFKDEEVMPVDPPYVLLVGDDPMVLVDRSGAMKRIPRLFLKGDEIIEEERLPTMDDIEGVVPSFPIVLGEGLAVARILPVCEGVKHADEYSELPDVVSRVYVQLDHLWRKCEYSQDWEVKQSLAALVSHMFESIFHHANYHRSEFEAYIEQQAGPDQVERMFKQLLPVAMEAAQSLLEEDGLGGAGQNAVPADGAGPHQESESRWGVVCEESPFSELQALIGDFIEENWLQLSDAIYRTDEKYGTFPFLVQHNEKDVLLWMSEDEEFCFFDGNRRVAAGLLEQDGKAFFSIEGPDPVGKLTFVPVPDGKTISEVIVMMETEQV